MRARLPIDLLVVITSTLLLSIVTALLPSNVLRIILGVPLVFFYPGYTLVCILFPRRGRLSIIERVAISVGLSLIVLPTIVFIMNFTIWGITLYPILTSVALFILVTSAVAWYRRYRLPQDERLEPSLRLNLHWGEGRLGQALTVLLFLSAVGAVSILVYAIVTPMAMARFTEFYILGLEGKAENYPLELTLGEEGSVTVGLVNQEQETTEYRVEIAIDGTTIDEIGPITLDDQEKWEQEVSFAPIKAGPDQKLQVWLYKGTVTKVYRKLHLWLDVKESAE